MPSAISTTDLTKHYPDVRALEGLSIEVPQGSIYGFLGANGAGKTTALKILAGLSRPTSGSATVAGVPLAAGESYKRAIGYLGQEPRFYDWMTARQTLRYVAGFYPWVRDPIERRIDEALEMTGIAAAADRPTRTYSGGMRQRLGIAQALIGRPQVLLLDEPASALDPIGRRDVLDLMEGLRGQATIFYSTHILDDVQRVSDHVAILDQGRLVRAAPTQELLAASPAIGFESSCAVSRTRPPAVSPHSPASHPSSSRVATRSGHLRDPGASRPDRCGPASRDPLRGRVGPHSRCQCPRAGRPRRGLPPPHRLQGACRMNA